MAMRYVASPASDRLPRGSAPWPAAPASTFSPFDRFDSCSARSGLPSAFAAWSAATGHEVVVVWEGKESADDRIAREVTGLDPPVWVVSSDRELRERVREHAERVIGGGSFARELRAQRE